MTYFFMLFIIIFEQIDSNFMKEIYGI